MKSPSSRIILTVILAFAFRPAFLSAQYFGKNKVQYRDFEWEFIQSPHFDVYYYQGGKRLAAFTADVAESSYVAIQHDLKFKIIKRIPILVYNSHNDFGQTNVTNSLIEESVGGFTEIFKDRVVLPFQGNYEEFRHVIAHELTHAVMFQMLYGRAMGSMVSGLARFQVPLWVAEGLAEFESLGWDTESDLYMRDAAINGYIPPVDMLSGFLIYKGGQSVLNFITETYGRQKLGELLNKIRIMRNMEEALKASIGLDTKELSDRWQKYLRRIYWPDISSRQEPKDIAKQLTDHTKDENFLNNSPSLSPQGDKLVFLSNRSDYIDLYLMNTMDKKKVKRLVNGQRSELFEELHWLRPGMGWSPDGRKIVMASKAGGKDALHIINARTGEVLDSREFDLEGIFSPDWSPAGDLIVFMGMKHGQSDLYIYDLNTDELRQLTNDVFSDMDPVWSPLGDEIAFVSDRRDNYVVPDSAFLMQNYNYKQTDLYTLDVKSGVITRQTADEADQTSPAFSPQGDHIAFISDQHGIKNIYMLDRTTGSVYPITNLLTGVSQISWSREGSRMAFSSFYGGGYDIFLLNNPLEIKPGEVTVADTRFVQKKEEEQVTEKEPEKVPIVPEHTDNFRNYVFGQNINKRIDQQKKEVAEQFPDTLQYKNDSGEYKTKSYKVHFTPDMVSGGAGYSQFFGLQGSTLLAFSDILGNHRIEIYSDIFYSLKNSNFLVSYYYLPKQTDLGISLFHYSYLFFSYYTYLRDRNYGFALSASHPFNRYRRLNASVTGFVIDRDWGTIDPYGFTGQFLTEEANLFERRVLLASIGYSTDTVVWGWTGPVNGGRSAYNFQYSPLISKDKGLDFWTVTADWRRYLKLNKDLTLALRFSGGVSGGKQPQRFLLGGMLGWINYGYAQIPDGYWGDDLFYFSTLVTPMRGALYYQMVGTRYALANIEFRFPLIRYLILGWPLPIGFQNIRGAVFLDTGSAWSNDKSFKPVTTDDLGTPKLNDLMAGFGFGMRVNLGFFLIKYDVAWRTDFYHTDGDPVQYLTMSAEF